ncbi:hypothetical protein BV898_03375 [Hypsibius exemplaris]|uniref:G-protein coupled receptors family 1 profile domain-containing protein n=1 Tax=Hypsibius exemplaris TaxID=2072580 RepID=A0A1W0X4W8_HYPEX|nr:hypothetical protein BV898_03375 [Hypsibius exemplaris]
MTNQTNTTVTTANLTEFGRALAVHKSYKTSITIWTAFELTVIFAGALLNAVTLAVTVTHPPLRRASSCALLCHCISIDLFMTLCTQPGSVLISYIGPDATTPWHFCQIWGGVAFGAYYLNIWAHCLLAVNRFIAFVFPHHYKYAVTKPVLIGSARVPWLMAGILEIFPVAGINMTYEPGTSWPSGCHSAELSVKTSRVLNIMGIYLPCVIIGVCYSVIIVKAKIAATRRNHVVQPAEVEVLHHGGLVLMKRYQMSKILFLCFLWFCVANFPQPIAGGYLPVRISGDPLFGLSMKGLQSVSCAINPIFFLLISKDYIQGRISLLMQLRAHFQQRLRWQYR